MRRLTCLTATLLGTAVMIAQPPVASAEGDPNWQTCVGSATAPNDRVTACSAVIDGRAESRKRLAAAHCNRGHGLTEKRDLDSAMSDLNEAIRLDPAYACAYSNRGRVYAFKRDFDHAMADYDEAIRIDPGFALAYNNRGDAWFNKGDLDSALADFSAAIKYDPSLAIAYGNRGFAHYRKRDMARALADYSMQSSSPTCSLSSIAATSIAIPNGSTVPPPITARRRRSRRPTRGAGATAA
jgi:tetratricopeptide (TPR) repeat protein